MKTYKFEIELKEWMLEGDEFWEDALESDPTGIKPLQSTLENSLDSAFPAITYNNDIKWSDIVRLKSYEDK